MIRKQIKTLAARYLKFVEWSDEDGVFVGQCPALFHGGVHGHDEAAVYADLCKTVEEWIELLHRDGKPLPDTGDGKKYSGKFVVRVEPALHRRCIGAWRQKRRRRAKASTRTSSTRWSRRNPRLKTSREIRPSRNPRSSSPPASRPRASSSRPSKASAWARGRPARQFFIK